MKRKQALKQDLKHYFTGRPCIRGHIANRTSKDGVCIKCASTLTQEWQLRNKDQYTEYQHNWVKNNPEYERTWRLENGGRRDKYAELRNLRVPSWLTKEDWDVINFFYKYCPEGFNVDHIIPLRGKNISGLHVPHNLQWLPTLDNLRKGNTYDVAS